MYYKYQKEASLSVCMIVRDEEGHLAGCLDSVQAIADQVVIIDTGSVDSTENIARQFGAEVYFSPWENDFAAARNVSLSYATGDWILWLDADERLMPESLPVIAALCQPALRPIIYNVNIKNLQKDGHNYSLSRSHRFFSRQPGIYFTGPIHEQFLPAPLKSERKKKTPPSGFIISATV
jgi:glycosyltransferase involved in cell wall biosynthesis